MLDNAGHLPGTVLPFVCLVWGGGGGKGAEKFVCCKQKVKRKKSL